MRGYLDDINVGHMHDRQLTWMKERSHKYRTYDMEKGPMKKGNSLIGFSEFH